jgi:hypothetical protein
VLGRLLNSCRKEGEAVYISLYDLGLFILISLTITASAYLIFVLRQAFFLFSQARKIFVAHDDDIRATLSLLPAALVNINSLCVSLAEMAGQTNRAFQSVQTDVLDTVDGLYEDLEKFSICFRVIGEFCRTLFSKIL